MVKDLQAAIRAVRAAQGVISLVDKEILDGRTDRRWANEALTTAGNGLADAEEALQKILRRMSGQSLADEPDDTSSAPMAQPATSKPTEATKPTKKPDPTLPSGKPI